MPGPADRTTAGGAPGRHTDCGLTARTQPRGAAVPGHSLGAAVPVTRSRQTETPGPRDRAAAGMAGRHPSAAPSTHAQREGCAQQECRPGVGHSADRGRREGRRVGFAAGVAFLTGTGRQTRLGHYGRQPQRSTASPQRTPPAGPGPPASHKCDPAVSPSVPAARPGRPLPAPPPGRPGRRWNRGRRSSRTARSWVPRRPARCAG